MSAFMVWSQDSSGRFRSDVAPGDDSGDLLAGLEIEAPAEERGGSRRAGELARELHSAIQEAKTVEELVLRDEEGLDAQRAAHRDAVLAGIRSVEAVGGGLRFDGDGVAGLEAFVHCR